MVDFSESRNAVATFFEGCNALVETLDCITIPSLNGKKTQNKYHVIMLCLLNMIQYGYDMS